LNRGFWAEAEGEGFEPSIRLTTDNGFRDRLETAYLQEVLFRVASVFASARHSRPLDRFAGWGLEGARLAALFLGEREASLGANEWVGVAG
jgi:hypothetical protein